MTDLSSHKIKTNNYQFLFICYFNYRPQKYKYFFLNHVSCLLAVCFIFYTEYQPNIRLKTEYKAVVGI